MRKYIRVAKYGLGRRIKIEAAKHYPEEYEVTCQHCVENPNLTFQSRQVLVRKDAFLYDVGPSAERRPFSNATFQALLSSVHGINCDIPAALLAFVACKLSQLLSEKDWNSPGHLSQDCKTSYDHFLQLAISHRGVRITGKNGVDEDDVTWLRIYYSAEVRTPY